MLLTRCTESVVVPANEKMPNSVLYH